MEEFAVGLCNEFELRGGGGRGEGGREGGGGGAYVGAGGRRRGGRRGRGASATSWREGCYGLAVPTVFVPAIYLNHVLGDPVICYLKKDEEEEGEEVAEAAGTAPEPTPARNEENSAVGPKSSAGRERPAHDQGGSDDPSHGLPKAARSTSSYLQKLSPKAEKTPSSEVDVEPVDLASVDEYGAKDIKLQAAPPPDGCYEDENDIGADRLTFCDNTKTLASMLQDPKAKANVVKVKKWLLRSHLQKTALRDSILGRDINGNGKIEFVETGVDALRKV